jgi:hypothetical protein
MNAIGDLAEESQASANSAVNIANNAVSLVSGFSDRITDNTTSIQKLINGDSGNNYATTTHTARNYLITEAGKLKTIGSIAEKFTSIDANITNNSTRITDIINGKTKVGSADYAEVATNYYADSSGSVSSISEGIGNAQSVAQSADKTAAEAKTIANNAKSIADSNSTKLNNIINGVEEVPSAETAYVATNYFIEEHGST